MGPTVTRPVQDPLAVLRLDNRLYIYDKLTIDPSAIGYGQIKQIFGILILERAAHISLK